MNYRRDLKRLRRARRQLKRQRHELLALELQGIVTLTLHSVAESVTLALDSETQGELIDLLLAALRRRRLALQAEATQTSLEWQLARAQQQQRLSTPDEPGVTSPTT